MSVEKCGFVYPFFNVGYVQRCIFLPTDKESGTFSRKPFHGFQMFGISLLYWGFCIFRTPFHVASINLYKEL